MSAARTTTTRTLNGTGSAPTVAELQSALLGCPATARVSLRVSDSYRGDSSWTVTISWSGDPVQQPLPGMSGWTR